MKRTLNNTDSIVKKQKLAFGIVLALLIVGYNFIWLNRTFTLSEGWAFFYNGLLAEGKVPYRDFYYYLPPLNLLIDYIIWKCSFGYFFVYRIIRLIERVIIVEIMYKVISKRVDPFISFVGCSLATVMASANVYDLVGDYNQTVQLLSALLCVFVLKYAESFDNIKARCKWMVLIGACGGCMFLSKQTIVVATAVIFVGLIFLLFVTRIEKNLIKMIFSVGFGLAIPLGITFVYMVITHSLTEFLNQVFMDTSSKGSLVEIVFGTQQEILADKAISFALIIVFFLAGAFINKRLEKSDMQSKSKYIDILFCLLAGVIYSYSYAKDVFKCFEYARECAVLAIFVVLIAIICVINVEKLYGKIITVLVGIATVGVMFLNIKNYTIDAYNNTDVFKLIVTIATLVHFTLIVWMFRHIINHFVKKTPLNVEALVIVCSGLASGWATAMTNGEHDVLSSSSFMLIPAFVYIAFKNKRISNQVYVKGLIIATVLILSVCSMQKIACPYSWWGDVEAPYFDKTETSDIKALKGFKLSEKEKKRIDVINQLIEDNTDEESTIFGFPYIKIYNVFQENYNMNNFVPVLFYDVCSDNYAKDDAKLLAKYEPDIVVWHDIPICMKMHEELFRNNDALGQRKIQNWFYRASQTDYELIGQVDNIFVYKLKESGKAEKPYIEKSYRGNETLRRSDLRTVENTLQGSGKKKDPYIISTTDDLVLFQKLVNQGMEFEDMYVEQTADIDLGSVEQWTPIGRYERDNYFRGVYNGNGYRISNLTISYDEEKGNGYSGLFGQLYGTVENVVLENCDIEGTYAGGIASHGSYNAYILNCYVSGKINAEKRGGCIVDNNLGTTANCVSECEIISEKPAEITGYFKGAVANCYSSNQDSDIADDAADIDSDTVNKLNGNLSRLEKKGNSTRLNEWQMSGNKLVLTHAE